jgi:hypothetical protein
MYLFLYLVYSGQNRKQSHHILLFQFSNLTRKRLSSGCLNWRRDALMMKQKKLLIPVSVPTVLLTSMFFFGVIICITENSFGKGQS